ncbi:BTB/POZ and MATH domain-containing protein 6 [Symbiodinium microadriaticum]|uniref:BTB/POZ and MATH domain-containing protein 6 n=1 Tax=Symbiodinium microadriaticum TaxID=2951 RepID=A0A1Q9DF45_SYMMI|nr:BTB/POZ and MATH domain-containing protein 6 [Symbiodinium microadriaticum]
MTAEALRAEIEATKALAQTERARKRELEVATAEALERQRLRRELEKHRMILEMERAENAGEELYRRDIDADNDGDLAACPSVFDPTKLPPIGCRANSSGEEHADFGHEVAKGEYTWKLARMSWLRAAVGPLGTAQSEWFQVGEYKFQFVYNPDAGFVTDHMDGFGTENMCGSVAILTPHSPGSFTLRYSVFAKKCGKEFVQWGSTQENFKLSMNSKAFGPDVHRRISPPASIGVFGLSHEQLLQSEWVHDDALTLKFVLEVRPERPYSSHVLAGEVVDVPEPTLHRDTLTLLEEAGSSDMHFRVQGEVIHVHSQVLCARSEVFKKQLNSGMQEANSKLIVIEDCNVATFKDFLKFLYTDTLPTVEDLAEEPARQSLKEDGSRHPSQMEALWAVAHKYQVERLQRWCEAQLCKQLSAERVCSVLRQAHVFEATQLEKVCLSYIKDNFAEVLGLQAYSDLMSKWPEVALKVQLYSTGVPESQAAAIVQARKVRKLEDRVEKTS